MQKPSLPLSASFTHLALAFSLTFALSACEGVEQEEPIELDWQSEEFADLTIDSVRFPVPLDPDEGFDSGKAHIGVYRILSGKPNAKSLVLLQGGPGGDVGELALYFTPYEPLEPLHDNYDIYLVNTRGNGEFSYSFCANLEGEPEPDDIEAGLQQLNACIKADEPHLRNVSTRSAVFDLERLREHLEIKDWAVYGVSYGTGVAAAYAELFPASVSSLVLDGVFDPKVDVLGAASAAAEVSLERLRASCMESEACPSAFAENPRALIEALLAKVDLGWNLDAVDFDGTSTAVEMTHDILIRAILSSLADTELRLDLPYLLVEAAADDYTRLAELVVPDTSSTLGDIMVNLNVVCREIWRGPSKPFGGALFEIEGDSTYDLLCPTFLEVLGAVAMPHPGASEVPTLLMSGEGDMLTPPSFGDAVAGRFSNSEHITLLDYSHGVADSECGASLFISFLDTGRVADSSCANERLPWPEQDGFPDF